jgi:lipoic acid synthetase
VTVTGSAPLRVRWLGSVRYRDAHVLQRSLRDRSSDDHLLLLEHPHVYTLGLRSDPAHLLVEPSSVGAELDRADRGGDVTYHGPGQLVGYPILSLPGAGRGDKPDTAAYVRSVEDLLIDTLARFGLRADRLDGYPGVWLATDTDAPRKIAAIGVRITRGRTMHGFALNVHPDLAMFGHIVPCGIPDKAVTSMAAEGVGVSLREVVDVLVPLAVARWGAGGVERQDVAWRVRPEDLAPFTRGGGAGEAPDAPVALPRSRARLAAAGVTDGLSISDRKPDWAKARVSISDDYLRLKKTMRDLSLVTVCEEAGCPNIFECWADGTATFMINGERCTRACGFCLVDTRHPGPLDLGEPERVAEAVERMGLAYAVVTAVARDDLVDGGASGFAATITAIRRRTPGTRIEVLIPDCKGEPDALQVIFDAGPDVLNHNVETVPRLQRAVRPSAGYARSLAVLSRAKAAGLTTKSGLIVGLGETAEEVEAVLADLRSVGVDIVTVGQYLRPTERHLPVARWWTPEDFERLRETGARLGITHVEASPLTRSSHHARESAESVFAATSG